MQLFSIRTRAAISISIDDFGNENDKNIWEDWSAKNPDSRKRPDDPIDDGKGPMSADLRETILVCLRRRSDFMRRQLRSPFMGEDEVAELSSRLSMLYAIARMISLTPLEWPSAF